MDRFDSILFIIPCNLYFCQINHWHRVGEILNLVTILITLLILCVLVIVHELGHFMVAKKTGIFVEEFAIGMGPKLFGHQGKETLFTIRAFPVGGFCKMRGEEPEFDEENHLIPKDPGIPIDPRSYDAKSRGQKLLVLVAGSAMNIIFAIFCLIIVAFFTGHTNIFEAIGTAFLNTWRFSGLIFQSFGMLFTGQVGLDQLAGPIGMVSMVDTFMHSGLIILLAFYSDVKRQSGDYQSLSLAGAGRRANFYYFGGNGCSS